MANRLLTDPERTVKPLHHEIAMKYGLRFVALYRQKAEQGTLSEEKEADYRALRSMLSQRQSALFALPNGCEY